MRSAARLITSQIRLPAIAEAQCRRCRDSYLTTAKRSSASCLSSAGAGAADTRHCPCSPSSPVSHATDKRQTAHTLQRTCVVFGKAMTSRKLGAPASSITSLHTTLCHAWFQQREQQQSAC